MWDRIIERPFFGGLGRGSLERKERKLRRK